MIYDILNNILSFLNNPLKKLYGPFNIPSDANINTEPNVKATQNLDGKIYKINI